VYEYENYGSANAATGGGQTPADTDFEDTYPSDNSGNREMTNRVPKKQDAPIKFQQQLTQTFNNRPPPPPPRPQNPRPQNSFPSTPQYEPKKQQSSDYFVDLEDLAYNDYDDTDDAFSVFEEQNKSKNNDAFSDNNNDNKNNYAEIPALPVHNNAFSDNNGAFSSNYDDNKDNYNSYDEPPANNYGEVPALPVQNTVSSGVSSGSGIQQSGTVACPGGNLDACIDACPGFHKKAFGICVTVCGSRCP
jgi:hypothetical protein